MKGLICAGGNGTRLAPITQSINKHLVPILNQPMIVYPLKTLIEMGVDEILIVSGGEHIGGIAEFLGDGSGYGIDITYRVQKEAGGIAQAISLARNFIGDDSMVVILGDNVFESNIVESGWEGQFEDDRAHIFTKMMHRDLAKRFGVILPGDNQITEKPSYIAAKRVPVVTGIYIYPSEVFDIIQTLKPSPRGELEITSVNNEFLKQGLCRIHSLNGFWSDAGTRESLKNTIDWAYKNGV